MDDQIFIPAVPTGFVMLSQYGDIYLKQTDTLLSPSVGGDAWEFTDLLNLKVGQKELASFWEVRRENEGTITFEMIDPKSKVEWGVPLKMTIRWERLQNAALYFHLV